MKRQPPGARDLVLTPVTYQILRALLAAPDRPLYGQQIIEETGLASGSIYPALQRLHRHGWTIVTTEQGDPSQLRRPLRRYYQLTEEGSACARRAVAQEAQRLAALAQHLATATPPAMPVETGAGRQPGQWPT